MFVTQQTNNLYQCTLTFSRVPLSLQRRWLQSWSLSSRVQEPTPCFIHNKLSCQRHHGRKIRICCSCTNVHTNTNCFSLATLWHMCGAACITSAPERQEALVELCLSMLPLTESQSNTHTCPPPAKPAGNVMAVFPCWKQDYEISYWHIVPRCLGCKVWTCDNF